MPSYYIYGNAESPNPGKGEWTPTTGSTNWQMQDDAATPGEPVTLGSDRCTAVDAVGSGKIMRFYTPNPTIPANETQFAFRMWCYMEQNPGSGVDIGYLIEGAGSDVDNVTGTGWISRLITVSFSQSELNNLMLNVQTPADSTSTYICNVMVGELITDFIDPPNLGRLVQSPMRF